MYISPEFQLGQVYDGTIIDEESVLLYRPVYVRVAQKHGDSIGKSVSKHSKDANLDLGTINPTIHGSPSTASNSAENAVTAASSVASAQGPASSAPASRRTKPAYPNELPLTTTTSAVLNESSSSSVTKVQQVVVDLHQAKPCNSHNEQSVKQKETSKSSGKKYSS